MLRRTIGAVRSAKAWSRTAPRYQGEFSFGVGAEEVVFGVFGDSVGCGLGIERFEATFAAGVAARLALNRRVICRIKAFSGARGRDLARQEPLGDEGLVAVSIGTNDIIHGESMSSLERHVAEFIGRLKASRVVVLGPGALTAAAIVPPLLHPILARRVRSCESALKRAVNRFPHARHFGPGDLRVKLTAGHFAADGFHPGEVAHALIAEAVYARLIG
jgi:lysophospholipase L1-like esterase